MAETSTTTDKPVGTALLVGLSTAVSLGLYASIHQPTGRALSTIGFTSTITMKNWLTTTALLLLLVQGVMSIRAQGTLFTAHPQSTRQNDVHQLIGTVAFALTLPVVFHCVWSLGYQTPTLRVGLHSAAGCAVYGAWAATALMPWHDQERRWIRPTVGAVLAGAFVTTWWSGALWYFTSVSWSI